MDDSETLQRAKSFFIHGLEKLNKNNLTGAENDFESSLRFAPNRLSTLINLSIVLIKLNKYVNAEKIIQLGLMHHPKNNELLMGLVEIYSSLIKYKPDYAEAYSNRGIVFNELKKYQEALKDYDKAIEINPDYAEAYSNRGNVFYKLKKYQEALKDYDKAIAIKPDYAVAYSNRGIVFYELKKYQEALKDYDKAIEINPDYADAYWNKSLTILLVGDFSKGWELYEWRWMKENSAKLLVTDKPLWLGDSQISGKTILLHSEQGLGDTIQFCRYVKLVKELGARVILEVPKALTSLMSSLTGVDEIIESGQALPDFDFHCPLMSLPLAFKTTLDSIPECPEFVVSDIKKNYWAQKLGVHEKFRVGLVWSGSSSHLNDHNRSLCLKQLLPYLPDLCEYVSLQSEVREIDKQVLDGSNIKHFGNELNDFSDTAALCELMNLVISVDTSVAHLAASIGKGTTVLLPYSPDFRWLLEREDSPWYPSIKLYRQTNIGDWSSVIQRVRADLEVLSKNSGN